MIARISVVTAVYNGAINLLESLATVLNQKDVDAEFIIVDDGSTDDTPELLRGIAAEDKRVHIINQPNRGLTNALIRGCSEANGEFIARHDCGDSSLPDRLSRQLASLQSDPTAAFHSCGTRFLTPERVELYTSQQTTEELNRALRSIRLKTFYGPSSHPSVLFRSSTYRKCGGYRPEFYFAQDLDLWARMVQSGHALAESWIGYETVFDASSLSGEYGSQQQRLRRIIYQLTKGLSPEEQKKLLRKAASIRPRPGMRQAASHWRGNYFMASCLAAKNAELAHVYLKKALEEHPISVRSWLKYLMLSMHMWRKGTAFL